MVVCTSGVALSSFADAREAASEAAALNRGHADGAGAAPRLRRPRRV